MGIKRSGGLANLEKAESASFRMAEHTILRKCACYLVCGLKTLWEYCLWSIMVENLNTVLCCCFFVPKLGSEYICFFLIIKEILNPGHIW